MSIDILLRGRAFLFLGLSYTCFDGLSNFEVLDIDILLDAELFNDRSKDVLCVRVVTIISIHAATSTLLLFKRLLDRIYLIKSVKFVDDLSKNRLTVPCQEIEELFILLDIVGLLLTNNDRVILIGCGSVRVGCFVQNAVTLLLSCLLLLQFIDVAMAQVMSVSDQFLTIEACHHTMLQRLLVAEKLG